MNEHFKQDNSSVPEGDLSVGVMLKKIQQQLNFLEKKIDILMGQSSGRPSFKPSFNKDRNFSKERHFSKPFRPGGGGGGFRQDRGSDRPREREFSPERQFDKPHETKSGPPERGRKAFFRRSQQRNKGKGHF